MTSKIKRTIVLALLGVIAAVAGASAETLMMPKRDALRNVPVVIWGVTTLPNHTVASPTTFTINFGDGTANVSGNVTDRSYINTVHTFPNAGTFTVTLVVQNGATIETATVDVRAVDPAALGGPGTTTGNVGPGSNEVYRDVRINMAIQDGLRYLWTTQRNRTTNFPAGTMVDWSNQRQWSAFAVTAFENHGYRLPSDPLVAPTGIYEKYLVQKGLNFIVSGLSTVAIANQPTSSAPGQPVNRDPCVGTGIEPSPCSGLTDTSQNPGYTVGIAMMPLAASSALNRVNGLIGPAIIQNKPYREILQRLANTLSWGQIDANVVGRGGWGYTMNTTTQDGSVMGWAILGLLDAQAAGITVPAFVKTELPFGITGGWNSNGSFDYTADGAAGTQNLTGMEKAGVGLQGMFMIGEVGSARVATTRSYIAARWNTAGRIAPDSGPANCGGFPTNKSCVYSMFNNFKGLQLQNIQTLPGIGRAAGPGTIAADDWHADYEDWFVNNQITPTAPANGQWSMFFSNYVSGNDVSGNTAVAELILSGVALVLPDADKFQTVGLSPNFFAAVEGGTHTVTAHAESSSAPGTPGTPIAGASVNFLILSGPNAGRTGSGVTDALGNATFTYTDAGPIPSFGTDRIQASIGTLQSNIVEMLWTPFNRPPVANPNSYSVNEDGTLNGNVVTDAPADTDPDNDELIVFVGSNVSHGVLALLSSGGFQYLPIPNYCGPDSFTYSVNDGMYDSNVATVSINVVCVNDPPVADDGTVTTIEDTAVNGQLTSSDIDGGAPVYSVAIAPSQGSVGINPNGSYTYTPNANFCGGDSFTFNVSDGSASDTGAVSVTVDCVNDPPVADDGTATTNEDTAVNGQLSSSDVDGGAPVYSVNTAPAHGNVVINGDGSYTYTPNANVCEPDSFTFDVSDGSATDTGAVSVTVNCVNDPPVADDGTLTTIEDTAANGQLTSSDIDGGAPIYSLNTAPAHGGVVINADGSYTYTPNANSCEPDSFTFSVSDGSASDTGAVSVTVNCVNDPPVADDGTATTNEDTAVNGQLTSSDVDGGAPVYSVNTAPAHGNVVINADGSYTYTPNANFCLGGDSFTFNVSDGSATDTGAVSVTVNCVNDPPVADDGTVMTIEDTVVNGQLTSSDVDGGAPSYSPGSSPSNGSVVINAGGSYTYTPNANFCGTDSFTFNVSDGSASDAGAVSVTVNCVNDPPVANDASVATPEDTAFAGTLTSSDIDGGAPSYVVATGPSHGTVTVNPNGSYTYTPNANYNGPDSFTFTVNDGAGGSDGGQVSINVTPVNDAPFCAAAGPSIGQIWPPNHQLVDINVLGVTDPVEGSAITIRIDSIWQDEPTNTIGDGNTPIDGYGVGTSIAQVRAERSGSKQVPGNGRMYHIFFTGTDAQGGTCTGEVKVAVPHDEGAGNTVGDGGPLYRSTGS